ncbi:MAG: iron ABC transporter permease [Acidimicrobiia bacterium]|nr:iron ABC transporter permease [Acidimicrobiia bacterium]
MGMRPSSAASQASPLRFGAPLAAAAVLGVLAGYPLWRLVAEALSGGGMGDALSATGVRTAAFNSLWTSAAAATLAAAAGTAVALLTERYRIRGAAALRVAMVGTLIVPPFVSAVSWQATYAPFGLLDDLTGLSGGWIDGRVGVVVVIAVNVAPLAFLVVAAALRGSRLGDVERAARAAGAADAATLRSITLPLIRPALAAAWLVGFAAALANFGVTTVLGTSAGFDTLTTRVYRAIAFSAREAAFQEAVAMALVLVLLALVVIALTDSRFVSGRMTGLADPTTGRIGSMAPAPPGAAALAWGYLTLSLMLPLGGLVLRALTRAVGVSASPGNWTLANFRAVWDARTWEALGRSAALAASAALLALAVAGLLVFVSRTGNRRWGSAAAVMFAVPGTSIALAVSLGYGRWIANTAAIILVAYVAKLLVLAHRPLAGSAVSIHPDLLRAGRAAGAGPGGLLRWIVAPMLRSAIVAGAVLVFVFAVHELTMSSLLRGPGNETLAVVVLDYQQIGDPTVTAALAVVLAIVIAVVAAPLLWLRRVWGAPQ